MLLSLQKIWRFLKVEDNRAALSFLSIRPIYLIPAVGFFLACLPGSTDQDRGAVHGHRLVSASDGGIAVGGNVGTINNVGSSDKQIRQALSDGGAAIIQKVGDVAAQIETVCQSLLNVDGSLLTDVAPPAITGTSSTALFGEPHPLPSLSSPIGFPPTATPSLPLSAFGTTPTSLSGSNDLGHGLFARVADVAPPAITGTSQVSTALFGGANP